MVKKEGNLAEIKKKYEVVRKKYKLPKFEELDQEFDIRLINKEGDIIKEVRRAILVRIDKCADIIAPAISLEPVDLHSMIEASGLKKDDKKKMFSTYKKLGHLLHAGLLASFDSEQQQADFIRHAWNKWAGLRREVQDALKKITYEWTRKEEKEENVGYLG